MRNKSLGGILILVSIIFIAVLVIFKIQVDALIDQQMILSGGNCIIDGECIHEQSNLPIYLGVAVIFFTLALGLYLIFFERGQRQIEQTQKQIVNTLKESKEKQDEDEKFEILLKALNKDEKKVMRTVKQQNGIEQATLRIRTDLSKTKLSVILTELEKKGLVKKVPQGKKNRIHLKNLF